MVKVLEPYYSVPSLVYFSQSVCPPYINKHKMQFRNYQRVRVDCVLRHLISRLCLGQKVALEHTAKTTDKGQLAHSFCNIY